MDMRIAGSGQIGPGEYENIRISGSGKLSGFVRCDSFHASGSAKGEELECRRDMKISGSSKFEKNVSAGSLSVSGSLGVGGSITVEEKISCAGSSKITGSVRCAELTVSGGITAGGDVEAEKVKISGKIHCGGLLNAEEITVKFSTGMEIGAIGGGKIAIYRDHSSKSVIRLPLLSSLIRDCGGSAVHVKTCIEGDQIALEGVTAQRVSGRVVAIGADCQIDLVQYSEQLEVSPDAKVGATEKI